MKVFYVSKSIFIEFRTRKNMLSDLNIAKIDHWLAEGDPSLRLHGVGGHLGRHIGSWKCPYLYEIYFPDFVCHTVTLARQTRLFQSINVIFWQVWQYFHWRATPKWFMIKVSPWYMPLMFPKVFPLNLGPRKSYKKTQRSPKSVKGLQNEVHYCESLELAAILDAILDFANAQGGTQFTR